MKLLRERREAEWREEIIKGRPKTRATRESFAPFVSHEKMKEMLLPCRTWGK